MQVCKWNQQFPKFYLNNKLNVVSAVMVYVITLHAFACV